MWGSIGGGGDGLTPSGERWRGVTRRVRAGNLSLIEALQRTPFGFICDAEPVLACVWHCCVTDDILHDGDGFLRDNGLALHVADDFLCSSELLLRVADDFLCGGELLMRVADDFVRGGEVLLCVADDFLCGGEPSLHVTNTPPSTDMTCVWTDGRSDVCADRLLPYRDQPIRRMGSSASLWVNRPPPVRILRLSPAAQNCRRGSGHPLSCRF